MFQLIYCILGQQLLYIYKEVTLFSTLTSQNSVPRNPLNTSLVTKQLAEGSHHTYVAIILLRSGEKAVIKKGELCNIRTPLPNNKLSLGNLLLNFLPLK